MLQKLYLSALLVVFQLALIAQTNVITSGIINDVQAPVSFIDYCTNSLQVPNGLENNFAIGDKVLIIQMKGAIVDFNDNQNNGNVLNYASAGNYEINEVRTINFGSIQGIQLTHNLERQYITSAKVQVIKIPVFEGDVEIQNTLSCLPWNGEVGGILIFESTGEVIINANINVDERGFRGAGLLPGMPSGCFSNLGFNGYNCVAPTNCGANKGEGIGLLQDLQNRGRGRNGNGGGGGNDHNAGGGGGAAFGNGGKGGEYGEAFCFGIGGLGGQAIEYNNTINKIFMSGAGGAGEQNNNEGTAGGTAGGTVIIIANNLSSNGFSIFSKGESILDVAGSDGAGGGGAGGLVILDTENVLGNLTIDMSGGSGGNIFDTQRCPGPGGGGSGGTLWLRGNSLPNSISLIADGGDAGLHAPNSNAACANTSYGAEPGEDGGVVFNFEKFVSNELFIPFSLSANASQDTICVGETIDLTASANASREFEFEWQTPEGNFQDFNIEVSPSQNGVNLFTAFVSFEIFNQNCEEEELINVFVSNPDVEIIPDPSTMVAPGDPIFLTTIISPENPNYIYQWEPQILVNPANERNAIATPFETAPFCLTVTDNFDCSKTECVNLLVEEVPTGIPTAFSPNGDGINDVFEIFPEPILEFVSIKIYNRWGKLLYESNSEFFWDGKFKNEIQPPDIYAWNITLENKVTGKKTFLEGNVHLLK